MKRPTAALLLLLFLATAGAGQTVADQEDTRLPGTLILDSVSDASTIYLDGEQVATGRQMRRFGGQLLLAPGVYTVVIVRPGAAQDCVSQVTVREGERAAPRCGWDSTPSTTSSQPPSLSSPRLLERSL